MRPHARNRHVALVSHRSPPPQWAHLPTPGWSEDAGTSTYSPTLPPATQRQSSAWDLYACARPAGSAFIRTIFSTSFTASP